MQVIDKMDEIYNDHESDEEMLYSQETVNALKEGLKLLLIKFAQLKSLKAESQDLVKIVKKFEKFE